MFWSYGLYVVLLALSALVVAAEMATYCTRRERLLQLWRQGNRGAKLALVYLRIPRLYLAGSQLAITALTLATGALMTSTFTGPITAWLHAWGLESRWANVLGFWGTLLALTLFSTIFVNLLPKRAAFAYADEFAVRLARPAWVWIRLTGPLLRCLNWVVDVICRLAGIKHTPSSDVTEADVLTLLAEGRKDKLINPLEYPIVQRALALSDLRMSSVMTARENVSWLDIRARPASWRAAVVNAERSYIPVADSSLDRMLGVLRARDFLASSRPPSREKLSAMLFPHLTVSHDASVLQLLSQAKATPARLAAVTDAQGRVLGIATLNDVVVELLGSLASVDDVP
jgi:putative hemolysin